MLAVLALLVPRAVGHSELSALVCACTLLACFGAGARTFLVLARARSMVLCEQVLGHLLGAPCSDPVFACPPLPLGFMPPVARVLGTVLHAQLGSKRV